MRLDSHQLRLVRLGKSLYMLRMQCEEPALLLKQEAVCGLPPAYPVPVAPKRITLSPAFTGATANHASASAFVTSSR